MMPFYAISFVLIFPNHFIDGCDILVKSNCCSTPGYKHHAEHEDLRRVLREKFSIASGHVLKTDLLQCCLISGSYLRNMYTCLTEDPPILPPDSPLKSQTMAFAVSAYLPGFQLHLLRAQK
uniref:Uncharacterized protein n=1 Tax=Micrurus spixii TaxID=129469 RepID=A0A2D4NI75_9SAUR